MTLRLRLTLVIGGVVVLAVAIASWAAYLSAADRLTDEIDRFVVARAQLVTQPQRRGPPTGNGPAPSRLGERALEILCGPGAAVNVPRLGDTALAQFDSLTQVVLRDGSVCRSFPPEAPLPIDDIDRAVARGESSEVVRTVSVGDVRYRMDTAPIEGGGALQVARSMAETDRVLASIRARFLLIGSLATVVAASLVWLMARRASRPIEQLAARANEIAITQDLSTPLDVQAPGEVGQLAESFNAMLNALGTSKLQQQHLVQDAGHELRTPLTSLRTNIELLDRIDELDPADRTALMDDLRAEAVELSKLVEEIVELATDHRRSEIPTEVDVPTLARDIAQRASRRSGRQVGVTAAATSIPVLIRAGQFERATANLVDNALKFSDGPVDVTAEVSVAGTRVTVRDHGPGIAPSDLPHVFDRFFRADTSRSTTGSGLGLAIVAQFASDHGGRVFAGNAPDGGAVIGFDLPAVLPASAVPLPPPSPSPSSSPSA